MCLRQHRYPGALTHSPGMHACQHEYTRKQSLIESAPPERCKKAKHWMLKANFSSPKWDIDSWHNPNQSPEQLPCRLFTGAAPLGKWVQKVALVMACDYTSTLEAWIQTMTIWKQPSGTKNSGTAEGNA